MRPKTKDQFRARRHLRLRNKVKGTAERPRMSVFVTGKHMYVQFIDDDAERTLAAASTQSPDLRAEAAKPNVDTARKLGRMAAEAARERGVAAVVFDRGGFRYGGRVKALAEAAREAGLQF